MLRVDFYNLTGKIYFFIFLVLFAACSNNDLSLKAKKESKPAPEVKASGRVFKLLIMDSQSGEPYRQVREAMLESLNSWGYLQGENLNLTYFTIENDVEKGEEILKQQIANNYDIIFINGTVMTVAASRVLLDKPQQPVVFAANTDPVGIGVIEGFDLPPNHNFTGVHYPLRVNTRFKFIKELMPQARTIGLIYADMPQSRSYRRWVEELFETDPDFKDLRVIFRSVPLVTGKEGTKFMAQAAKEFVLELDPLVDVFLAPNDQMGVQEYFSRMVYANSTKPLVGLGKESVMDGWGATMVIYPSSQSMGRQAARMVKQLFEGRPIKDIYPEWPKENGFAFDLNKTAGFGIKVPVEYIELAGENIVQ